MKPIPQFKCESVNIFCCHISRIVRFYKTKSPLMKTMTKLLLITRKASSLFHMHANISRFCDDLVTKAL